MSITKDRDGAEGDDLERKEKELEEENKREPTPPEIVEKDQFAVWKNGKIDKSEEKETIHIVP